MTTTRKLKVGLDLDGVCYDFAGSLRRYLVSTGRLEAELPDAQVWEFYHEWGLDLDGFIGACHAGVDAGIVFRTGDPFPGVPEAVEKLHQAGCEIHIITDRSFGAPGASADATRAWLAENGIRYHSITFSRDKTVVPVDVFIEDRLENYDALDQFGVESYLVNRPWNWLDDSRRRVPDLHGFVDRVLSR